MRKAKITLCLSLAMLLLLGGATVAVAVELHRMGSEVLYSEERFFGDPSAAEGFVYHLDTVGDGHLLFQTDVVLGAEPSFVTEYSYEESITAPEKASGAQSWLVADDWTEELKNSWSGNLEIERLYREMVEEAAETDRRIVRRTVKLADYFSVIPLRINTGFLPLGNGILPDDRYHDMSYVEKALALELRIPVDPSWEVSFQVEAIRDVPSEEIYYEWSYSGDIPYVRSEHLITEDAVYIALRSAEVDGRAPFYFEHKTLGVYRIPLDLTQFEAEAIRIDRMRQTYKPAEGVRIFDMATDPVSGDILLLAHDGEGYSLITYDYVKDTVKATVELGKAALFANYTLQDFRLTVEEELAVFRAKGEFLTRLARNEAGLWQVAATVETRGLNDPYTDHYWLETVEDASLSYQVIGDRWAILLCDPGYAGCGFQVMVYEGETLAYHAWFQSSLDTGYSCQPLRFLERSYLK